MFTHDQIWAAIDRLADSRGLSASGLAKQSGLDPTAFNRSKRVSPNGKPRWPSTESVAKILAVTDCTMTDLFSLIDEDKGAHRAVAVYAFSNVKHGRLSDKNNTLMKIAFDTGKQSFATTMEDDRFAPLFRVGSTIVADPEAKLKNEDRVLFYTKKDGLKCGILQGAPKKTLTLLMPSNNFKEASYAEADMEWTAKILWASQ